MGLETAQVSGVRGMAGWDSLLLVPHKAPPPQLLCSLGPAGDHSTSLGTGLPSAPFLLGGLLLHTHSHLDMTSFLAGSEHGSSWLLGVDSISVSVCNWAFSCCWLLDGTFVTCPVLSPSTFRTQESGVAWAHRL